MSETVPQTIYMDAVLTPNASLSPRGYAIVTGIIKGAMALSALVLALSLFSMVMGAHMPQSIPIFGFLGLDIAALWLALRVIRKRGREETRIVITADTIEMHHRDPKGAEKHASLPSAFARVELDTPVGPTSWLRIEHGKTAYVIGRFLTPEERESLANALRSALQRARAERYPA